MSLNSKQILWRFLGIGCFIGSIIQLLAISNRLIAIVWQYYKFHGYDDNSGIITVNYDTQLAFFIITMVVMIIGYVSWIETKSYHWKFSKLIQLAPYILLFGLVIWTILLLSPFVVVK